MSHEQIAVEALSLTVTAALFAAYWWHVRTTVRVDVFRDDLFEIRSRLFDRMQETGKPFDDPAYTKMRDLLNGSRRWAETMHPITVMILTWREWGSDVRKIEPAVLTQDVEIQESVRETVDAYRRRLARFVFLGHATGWVLAIAILVRAALLRRPQPRTWFTDNRPLFAVQDEASEVARTVRKVGLC